MCSGSIIKPASWNYMQHVAGFFPLISRRRHMRSPRKNRRLDSWTFSLPLIMILYILLIPHNSQFKLVLQTD